MALDFKTLNTNQKNIDEMMEALSNYSTDDIIDDFNDEIPYIELVNQIDYYYSDNNEDVSADDLLTFFITRYNTLKKRAMDTSSEDEDNPIDDNDLDETEFEELEDSFRSKFFNIINHIQEAIDFELDIHSDIPLEELIDYTYALYTFFFMRKKSLLVNLGIHLIKNNLQSILDNISIYSMDTDYKKNLSYINLQKQVKSDDDHTQIIYFLPSILKSIKIEPDQIIEISTDMDRGEIVNSDVNELFYTSDYTEGTVNFQSSFEDNFTEPLSENSEIYLYIRGELIDYFNSLSEE